MARRPLVQPREGQREQVADSRVAAGAPLGGPPAAAVPRQRAQQRAGGRVRHGRPRVVPRDQRQPAQQRHPGRLRARAPGCCRALGVLACGEDKIRQETRMVLHFPAMAGAQALLMAELLRGILSCLPCGPHHI